jgi:hypothetical protein
MGGAVKTALWVLLVVVGAVFGFQTFYFWPTTVAHRLSLTVEVNGQIFSGSGVIVTQWRRNPDFLGTEGSVSHHVRGEAVTVDLGKFGVLAVTLGGKYGPSVLPMVVFGEPGPVDRWGYWRYLAELARPKPARDLPLDALPLVVLFPDPAQPGSGKWVDPLHMEMAFPPDTQVKLIRVTLAIVDESATVGIDRRLPWMALSRKELVPSLTSALWNWDRKTRPVPEILILAWLKTEM